MRADLAGQGQKAQALFQRQLLGHPALGHRLAGWFGLFLGHRTALDVGPEAPLEDADFVALILAQQFPIGRDAGCLAILRGRPKGARIPAFGIVRATDKGTT